MESFNRSLTGAYAQVLFSPGATKTHRIKASGVLIGVWKSRERERKREHRKKSPTIDFQKD